MARNYYSDSQATNSVVKIIQHHEEFLINEPVRLGDFGFSNPDFNPGATAFEKQHVTNLLGFCLDADFREHVIAHGEGSAALLRRVNFHSRNSVTHRRSDNLKRDGIYSVTCRISSCNTGAHHFDRSFRDGNEGELYSAFTVTSGVTHMMSCHASFEQAEFVRNYILELNEGMEETKRKGKIRPSMYFYINNDEFGVYLTCNTPWRSLSSKLVSCDITHLPNISLR